MSDFTTFVPNAPPGRYDGIERPYTVAEVERLRGSFPIACGKAFTKSPISTRSAPSQATRPCRWSERV